MPPKNLKLNIIIFLSSITILPSSAIIVGGGGGGRRFEGSSSSAASSSSEEGHSNHHHHNHHNHGPKPTPSPPAKPKCEENWYTSYRPQGIWCLRDKSTNYNLASTICLPRWFIEVKATNYNLASANCLLPCSHSLKRQLIGKKVGCILSLYQIILLIF
ncbi:hypothetical protein CAEBREN_13094 [Caenorhabditis brenneri]|uniref:Uncharacterized protein n=1 Tax=Caenorhabditis brenneri TaxID=135651 RepID=G0NZS3_CAEBE|nr:hypothetical protein CAEBREN_13094 [Caenorhabditis brenneri]